MDLGIVNHAGVRKPLRGLARSEQVLQQLGVAPAEVPDNAPVEMPENAPVEVPDNAPVEMPGNAPVEVPDNAPASLRWA